ncbi:endoribonuclease L-PSP [Achromobacter sp. RTa]|uniref:RidA family protein n=1 Tax=Achromobacter sp. RTa TaxID=1532557 RepID=UPI0005105086|nr:RidA family protein [Achromobacter sp. RTa]KGD87827.1 endoribonuclease L-PSP [Achromobacter sp. RTa]
MSRTVVNPDSVFDSVQYGFSQAVIVTGQRRMLLSGQVGVDADARTVGPGLQEQTEAALDNIERVLAVAGGTLGQVIMLRIYICESAREDQEVIAQALRDRFKKDPPPSSWIIVSGLSLPEWLIEIEAEAMLDC